MDDGAALRAAVRANRGQATPRLVYADWLDDNGDPVGAALQRVLARPDDDGMRLSYADAVEATDIRRAAFVRTQLKLAGRDLSYCGCGERMESRRVAAGLLSTCRMCRTDGPPWRLVEQDLYRHRQVDKLLAATHSSGLCDNRTAWAGPVASLVHPDNPNAYLPVPSYQFVRGFVEEVTTAADRWLAHADAITDDHPVRGVRLTTTPPYSQHNDHRKRVTAIWFNGREDVWYGVSEWDMVRSRGYDHAAEVMRDAVLGLLRLNWPDIEFELPPVPPRGQLADFDTSGAAATFNRAADAARQLATVTEAAIRAVTAEYGIEDAAQAARDRRMVRVEGVGDRPVWVVPCDCGQDLTFRRADSAVVNQNDIVFRTVQLRANVYTVGDQTRFAVHRGRCDGCGVVYFSVRRR